MTKKLSQAAQVAKLLKNKAKDLGMKVTATSQYFSMGNSVNVKVLTGTDDALKTLKDYAIKHEAGTFDGMNDIYNYDNVRDDIAQTKYLFVDDQRAQYIMDTFKGDKYDDLECSVDGQKVRSWHQLVFGDVNVDGLQKTFGNDGWMDCFKDLVDTLNADGSNGVTTTLNGKVFKIKKLTKEAA